MSPASAPVGLTATPNGSLPTVTVAMIVSVEGLITEQLRSGKIKNWFRGYLNLGLIEKILGHPRLIPCVAGTGFAFCPFAFERCPVAFGIETGEEASVELRQSMQPGTDVRCDQLRSTRGRRGAHVGHKVRDRKVDLVTHSQYGRNQRSGKSASNKFLVEAPHIFDRAASALRQSFQ